jgi:hypothetical protein
LIASRRHSGTDEAIASVLVEIDHPTLKREAEGVSGTMSFLGRKLTHLLCGAGSSQYSLVSVSRSAEAIL